MQKIFLGTSQVLYVFSNYFDYLLFERIPALAWRLLIKKHLGLIDSPCVLGVIINQRFEGFRMVDNGTGVGVIMGVIVGNVCFELGEFGCDIVFGHVIYPDV